MVGIWRLDSRYPAYEDVVIDYLLAVGHFGFAVVEASPGTSPVWDSFEDEVTFVAEDSFVEITVEKALDTEGYFHVAVWQVLVLNWVSRLELVVVRRLELLPFDFHSSVTFHVPFDEAFEQDYVLVEFDDSLGLSAEPP